MGADLDYKNGQRKGVDRYTPPLTINQKIWFIFLLPTVFCCIVYIADVATDIALVERHFAEDRCFAGSLTVILMYSPSVVHFILTMMDASKWPESDKKTSKKVCWVLKNVGLMILFPVHAIHRFAGKLFWSLEALLCQDLEKEQALLEAAKPSHSELYLLLQALLQALPQAFLQTYILASFKIPHERTGVIQFLSITTSIASAAIAASLYMRFESQRLAGRRTPWEVSNGESEKSGLKSKMSLMTTIESQITADTLAEKSPTVDEPEEDLPPSPKQPQLPKGVPQSAILSLPPLPPQIRAKLIKASGDELPEELQKEYDGCIEGEPLNIRSSIYVSEGKSPMKDKDPLEDLPSEAERANSASPASSLPDAPPPPLPYPFDIPLDEENEDRENESENKTRDQSLMDQSTEVEAKMKTASPSADQSPTIEKPLEEHLSREPLIDDTPTHGKELSSKDFQPIPLPTRKWKVEGLVEDDFLGKFIGFIWWFLFITARVLAMATFAFFYPWVFIIVFLLHYFGMVSYLFNCEKSKESSTKLLRLGLGFVYLFCFVEIRTRFTNPNTFTLLFVIVGIVENTLSSVAWYFFADWSSWWFLYAFFFVITSMILSILSMGLYFLILKPPTQDIYTN
ncbi:hypothetical protein RUM43_009207 [Polyplax serrata]|uniref:XK-related protein n=1 Tax=Polyplax serrata TaxID=468196 RepID=A0AAN8NUZ9_POLSC